ncbi:MAG: FkbM family methyltransferase [Desulfobacter sp.]
MYWELFESSTQFMLAHLLADTRQKDLFIKTNRCHERMFHDLVCRIIRPSHFLEIGAHEADVSQFVASRLPGAKCLAFEADPDVFGFFSEKHKKLSNFSYIHSAVSDCNGRIYFQQQVSAGELDKGMMRNNSIKVKQFPDSMYHPVEVNCCTVDSYLENDSSLTSAVLRIDAEGLCYEVLAGSRNTLMQTAAIYAEVEDYQAWVGQKTVFDVYPLLEDAGFIPVSRDVETPGQYNVLWLKHPLQQERNIRARLALYFSELQNILSCSALSSKRD